MKCPNCSAELNDNARFCPQCGMPIDADNTGLSTNGESEFIPTDPGNSADIFRAADEERRYEIPDNDYSAVDYQSNRAQRRAGRHNQKPNHSKKKPLIIAIIALVLVIAIVLGVIFFVSRKTVSAKEVQKAKDNYLPPAQAVTIDTSLTDPSNDKIKFTYDDRARIISCTYSVNKMTYDQSYTYDNTQRKINVETTYRAHPIFTKELDYDRVTKPDVFEEVDGYYIRLCKEDLPDAGATETPQETAAPEATEPPTDPPTEPPTEEPTDPPADWKDIYINFLDGTDVFYEKGVLMDLNNDGTPELLLSGHHQGAQVKNYHVCWISGGEVQFKMEGAMDCSYAEGNRNLRFRSSKIMYGKFIKYSFDGSSLSPYQSGEYNVENNEKVYTVDDKTISEDEYDATFEEGGTWNSVDFISEKSSLPDYIRNY